MISDIPWIYPVVVVDVGGGGGGEGVLLLNRLSSLGVGFGFLGRKWLDDSSLISVLRENNIIIWINTSKSSSM